MKTLVFTAISTTLLLMSCAKCVNCTKGSSSEKLCESNYSSSSTYEADVNMKETQGYTCTAE
ncbi:MAG: hypothetical protein M9931_07150 [Chitinophagales bacterium]|nr:hypothetical protein [Chitinophagales bacterium]MCO5280813.1 hypothetical protein [Chitinophagales bacterium]OJV25114.1 MAG: hypothetical protein BGO32_08335 [Bacteroidetes bacterium 37-13]HRN93225.1 hypothetical protein [Chitinophagales bacterium]HRP39549.1 hypothetical protein [Chitinophagales bacterium]